MSESSTVKDQARELVEALPDDATWEDLERVVRERMAIEAGIADADAGRVVEHERVREWLSTWGTDRELGPPR